MPRVPRLPRSLLVLAVAAATTAGLVGPAAAAPARTSSPGAVRPVLHGIDLESATIPDLQRAMDRGTLSAVRLTSFYLRRIRALEPKVNAVLAVNPDALRIAAASDKRRRHGGARSPLEGIPVLLKDNVDTRDRQPTTAGSLALLASRPARDAFLAARLRAAGAVVIGKANLSEWANFRSTNSTSGWSAVGGQTNNPYVLDRNPCGSSSGSGAGVAANFATVAIGTETDGSIVCPAGQNGIVGIKPTLGLVSRSGVVPISAQQDTAGPMAKNVVDAALTLSVLRGIDPADPATASSAPYLGVNYLAGLSADGLRGKRVGLWTAGTGADQDAPTLAVVTRAAADLRRLGATVVPVTLPYQDRIGAGEGPALENEFKQDIRTYLAGRPGPHPRDLAGLIRFNEATARIELRYFGQEVFLSAQTRPGDLADPEFGALRESIRSLARRSIDETLAAHDLDTIVAATNSPAWLTTLGEGDAFSVGSSSPAAVSGYPNVTVPAGFSGPLPVGLSFIGPRYGEADLLRLAYAFERGTQVRRPPAFLPTLAD
ncbi:MAG: N-carbamoylputrescine amidase [uncultured Corynebacteriales bacterium]|uniref:N-carbamoylputrescine amidase n=1 Tax=uncultured Mycobacteriales bacterium TaxID=581187 RepID=A0A6J4IDA9_9ACTN|nr:MAG: N-carbamoylputrescine amidase [uncultured Corynebacteriales bacterium]